jgi:hemerythrin-like domain-containing protein
MPTEKEETALDLLRADHERVRSMLQDLVACDDSDRKRRAELLEKIAEELRLHTTLEEEIFYPALRNAADARPPKENVSEAVEEHRAVEHMVLPDLENTDPGAEEFRGRAKVLDELVGHHADEEESKIFENARELLSMEDLQLLGQRMKARRQELVSPDTR